MKQICIFVKNKLPFYFALPRLYGQSCIEFERISGKLAKKIYRLHNHYLFFSPWAQLPLFLLWEPQPTLLCMLPLVTEASWNNTTKMAVSLPCESKEMLKIPWISTFREARKKWSPVQINDIKSERFNCSFHSLLVSYGCHKKSPQIW